MLVCDFPGRWRFNRLWMVLLLVLSPLSLCAESPEAVDTEILWTDDFPKVETRVHWEWPEFLSLKWPGSRRDSGEILSPEAPESTFGKLFGRIDWLSPGGKVPPVVSIPPEDPGLRPSLFSERAFSSDYEVLLVRGGVPQLFGARARLRGEYGDEFDDVKRIRGQMLLNLIGNHIGIDTSVNSWEDKRPGPKSLGDFWTGDANLVYSMGAQRVAMRGGLGTAWVYDNDLDLGYNFTYAADLFLTRPWLVSGEVDWGKINNEKLFHWRATFGVQLLILEIYVGYDSYKWNHIRFDGPVAGAGIWF